MRITMRDWSWVSVISTEWEIMKAAEEAAGGPLDYRTAELLYGAAVGESLVRDGLAAEAVFKMCPPADYISHAFRDAGGKARVIEPVMEEIAAADRLTGRFADSNPDPLVAVGPLLETRSQAIYYLALTLGPVQRQDFQQAFVWNEARRTPIFNDDHLGLWRGFELEVGMGILSAIAHAKHVQRELTPEELAAAMLRKYGLGIPLREEFGEVHACHWCGTAPCTCGGGKSPARAVTYGDAMRELHRGSLDTQAAMYLDYGWANIARGGVGYGPFRVLVEQVTEGGPVHADTDGNLSSLQRRFGPFFLPQQRHWKEVIDRLGRGAEARKKAAWSELADAVHWQFLYGPAFLDHTAGIASALRFQADHLGLDLDMPSLE